MIYLTKEEQHLVECFTLLPYAKLVLENDRKAIQQSHIKFQETYIGLIDQGIRSVSEELRNVKREVILRNIKIAKEADLNYLVFCKGYEERFSLHKGIAAQKVKAFITKHLHTSDP